MRLTVADRLLKASQYLAEAQALVSGKPTLYEYALTKPFSNGVPDGFVGTRKAKRLISWKWRHGVVQYRKPLPRRALNRYKLEPLTPSDPAVVDDIMFFLADDITKQLRKYDEYVEPIQDGKLAKVQFDLGPGGAFQVVFTDRSGKELGEPKGFKSLEEAGLYIWPHFTDKKKKSFVNVLLHHVQGV